MNVCTKYAALALVLTLCASIDDSYEELVTVCRTYDPDKESTPKCEGQTVTMVRSQSQEGLREPVDECKKQQMDQIIAKVIDEFTKNFTIRLDRLSKQIEQVTDKLNETGTTLGPSTAIAIPVSCSTNAYNSAFASQFQFKVNCQSVCSRTSQYKVWGSGIYTSDSSICRAAIHDGRITEAGGVVTVYKQPGQRSYEASLRHSIQTIRYGSWNRSFTFDKNDCLKKLNFYPYSNEPINSTISLVCPPNCQNVTYFVWGTTVYTDDSNICAAAIHNGTIIGSLGGEVVVRILSGRSSYAGTTQNGITTESYGKWPRSFSFFGQ